MLGQQLGQVAFHGLDDAAHAVGALAHHRGQALAFALAAFLQLRQRLLGSLQAGGAPDLGIERVVAALARPVEQFHQAGRGDVRQDSARGLQLLGQRFEPGRVEPGHVGAGIAREGHADLDLAARQLRRQQFAQRRFPWRSSSGRRKYRSRKRLLTLRSSSPACLAPGLPWRCRRRSCCGSWCVYPVLCRRDGASRPPAQGVRGRASANIAAGLPCRRILRCYRAGRRVSSGRKPLQCRHLNFALESS